jgi:hypothetical protein
VEPAKTDRMPGGQGSKLPTRALHDIDPAAPASPTSCSGWRAACLEQLYLGYYVVVADLGGSTRAMADLAG